MNAYKPEMSNGGTYDTTYRFFFIKPSEELLHFFFNTVWRRSNIVNFLASKYSTDYMLLVRSILSNFYLITFTVARREECSLPSI